MSEGWSRIDRRDHNAHIAAVYLCEDGVWHCSAGEHHRVMQGWPALDGGARFAVDAATAEEAKAVVDTWLVANGWTLEGAP